MISLNNLKKIVDFIQLSSKVNNIDYYVINAIQYVEI